MKSKLLTDIWNHILLNQAPLVFPLMHRHLVVEFQNFSQLISVLGCQGWEYELFCMKILLSCNPKSVFEVAEKYDRYLRVYMGLQNCDFSFLSSWIFSFDKAPKIKIGLRSKYQNLTRLYNLHQNANNNYLLLSQQEIGLQIIMVTLHVRKHSIHHSSAMSLIVGPLATFLRWWGGACSPPRSFCFFDAFKKDFNKIMNKI